MTSRPILARRAASFILATSLLVGGLAACSSSSDDTTADTTAAPVATDAAPSESAATDAVTTDSAAPASDAASDAGGAPAADDCAAMTTAFGDIIVNWQLIVGFSLKPDVKEWANISVGSVPKFGEQVALLKASLAEDSPSQEAVGYLEGANAIVQKGLAGDAAAGPELAAYIGTDITKALLKTTPIGEAMRAKKC